MSNEPLLPKDPTDAPAQHPAAATPAPANRPRLLRRWSVAELRRWTKAELIARAVAEPPRTA